MNPTSCYPLAGSVQRKAASSILNARSLDKAFLLPVVESVEQLFLVVAPLTANHYGRGCHCGGPLRGSRSDTKWTKTQSEVVSTLAAVVMRRYSSPGFMSCLALAGLASVLASCDVGGARAISMRVK